MDDDFGINSPDTWHTDEMDLPDFRVEGFHTGRKVRFRLSEGTEHEDVYQGYGIFGIGRGGRGYDWMGGEPHVIAWATSTSNPHPEQK